MLAKQLSTEERIVLAIDTPQNYRALELIRVAKCYGAKMVKFGLEISSAFSWGYCADLAEEHQLQWIADAKLHDHPDMVAKVTKNFATMSYPPAALTVHATSGEASLQAAHESADTMHVLGVTVLSSINQLESLRLYGKNTEQTTLQLVRDIAKIGLSGVVCSPREAYQVKSSETTAHLTVMVDGVTLSSPQENEQLCANTPKQALQAGADLVIVGGNIIAAELPGVVYAELINSLH